MNYERQVVLSTKKMCVIHSVSQSGEKKMITSAFFPHEMDVEEIVSWIIDNDDDMKNMWLSNSLDIEFKNVNAPDDWAVMPESQEDVDRMSAFKMLH